MYAIYPDVPIDGQTAIAQSAINKPYYAARDSSCCAGYVKHAVYLQHDWTGDSTFQAGWISWLKSEFADRNYWRVDGKPVVALFDPAMWNSDATAKANWLAMKAAVGPVYGVGIGSISTTAWTNLGLNGGTSYDAGLGASLTGNGQHAWADVVTRDQGNAAQPGFDVIEPVTTWNDRRARAGSEASTPWADTPTPFEELTAVQFAITTASAKITMISPATEIDESGPNLPTVEDGRRWWDPIDWVPRVGHPGTKPSTYTYKLDARHIGTAGATLTGTWARTNGQAGAYGGDYICSSTTNDTASITCNAAVIGASAATGSVHFRVAKSTSTGVADFTVGGVSQGTVDTGLASGGPSWDQDVKTVTCNLGDVVAIKVNGSHVLGSGNSVCIDNFQVTGAP